MPSSSHRRRCAASGCRRTAPSCKRAGWRSAVGRHTGWPAFDHVVPTPRGLQRTRSPPSKPTFAQERPGSPSHCSPKSITPLPQEGSPPLPSRRRRFVGPARGRAAAARAASGRRAAATCDAAVALAPAAPGARQPAVIELEVRRIGRLRPHPAARATEIAHTSVAERTEGCVIAMDSRHRSRGTLRQPWRVGWPIGTTWHVSTP